ncbi:MarR family winged helix-turn-helix transcriptional regulator [Streptomyces sp. NPDC054904]|uniref:MarR family winged helix-turn-helix transcriptional regulator n=1 Tax=unclassified Streptomyces TaxID=2593676 RepID=UPI0029AF435E|nr:MarR family winged helix-turn-helix transcriptional regulator [Streptomyces sp. DK15]MDX2391444.1 MarR family winged helix-turn-helix transcriptional regulator [Streptomyces sp. DK15]
MTEETRPADPPPVVAVADEVDDVTRAVLAASHLLVSISTRALAAAVGDGVTPAQFRMLDVLVARRHVKLVALAGVMAVNPSTAMRMVDRLIAAGLADRRPNRENRRETVLTATDSGARLVATVTARRRAETAALLARLGRTERAGLVGALGALAAAGGEPAEVDPHGFPQPLGRTEPHFPG